MIRIIDKKKIDLTDDEFLHYQKIVKEYTTNKFKGEMLFQDLFETDANGIIIFIRPSNKTHASMEVFLFIISIMVHQHLRNSVTEFDSMMQEMREQLEEVKKLKEELINEKSSL